MPDPESCPGCDASSVRALPRETAMVRSKFGAALYKCDGCATTFAWPQPSEDDDSYEQEYFGAYDDAGIAQVANAHLERIMQRLAGVASAPGRLLDVGIGGGEFLNAAKERGWQVAGLDVSKWAARAAHEKYGVEVHTATLQESPFDPGTFDVVHMSHVLEHLPRPVPALQAAARLLRPDGRLIIEVPNELENLYTWARLRSGSASPYPVQSTHLWFFSPATLEATVRRAGFEIDWQRSFRDLIEPRLINRVAKQAVDVLEKLTGRGPLIELVARRGSA